MRLRSRRSSGFTLIELLVVIAIIAILVSLLLPAVQQAREAARRTQCKNNLHNIGLALHNYHDTYNVFPNDTWTYFPDPNNRATGQARNFSWMTYLLPYMDQAPLYNSINFSNQLYGQTMPNGQTIVEQKIAAYVCPSDSYTEPSSRHGVATTNYAGSQGFDWWRRRGEPHEGMFSMQAKIGMKDIVDGTSSTIAVGEVASNGHKNGGRRCGAGEVRYGGGEAVFRMWALAHNHNVILNAAGYEMKALDNTAPSTATEFWRTGPYTWGPVFIAAHCINSEWPGPGSVHTGGMHALMADGAVRFINESVDYHGEHNGWNGMKSLWMSLNTVNGAGNDSIVGDF